MSFLLDTTAVSELGKPRPNIGFMQWFDDVAKKADAQDRVFVSVLLLGELDKGILKLDEGSFRRAIGAQRDFILAEYVERILPVDLTIARRWAEVTNRHYRLNLTVGAIDELVSATALVHDLTVVTRNVRHFEHSGCKLLSPWSA